MSGDRVTGATIRWAYQDGPTKGTKFEHRFDRDGTVVYRMLDGTPGGAGGDASERTTYEVARMSDAISVVTYLTRAGWTLTTVLDFGAGAMVSVASNEKQLFVQRGTFEVVG